MRRAIIEHMFHPPPDPEREAQSERWQRFYSDLWRRQGHSDPPDDDDPDDEPGPPAETTNVTIW